MVKFETNILSLILLCLIISPAQAQVTIDVSKITCDQFRGYKIINPNDIALWLSGYYNGRRGNTTVNVQSFKENLKKVADYCIPKPTISVMQAVEEVLGNGN